MTLPNWMREKQSQDALDAKLLLEMYRLYQDRQLWDLRLLYNYTNFYAAGLSALLTAFVVAFIKSREDELVGLLTLLPLGALLLAYNGRITAWRFYRRYTEGRVRLTKIEYALDLDGSLPVGPVDKEDPLLWAKESNFLPVRYFDEGKAFETSVEFTHKRSLGKGVGRLTTLMFNTFLLIGWVSLAIIPVCLTIRGAPPSVVNMSIVVTCACVAIGGVAWLCYWVLWRRMQKDYLRPPR